MVEFGGISHDLIDLRFHKVRIASLVHIAHVAKVEQSQVKCLRPRFKFRLRKFLEPGILGKAFERLKLEHAKRTQLVFKQGVVRIRRVCRCRCTAFGLVVRIAECRTFEECLRQEFTELGFASLVVLVVADAEAQVLHVGFIALGFGIVPQAVFFVIRFNGKVTLEHIARQIHKATLLKPHVIRRLHVRALCRAVIAKRHRNVVSKRIVQELVERHRNVRRHIELGGSRCKVRFRRAARIGERCKVAVLVTHGTRKRDEVCEVYLAIHTCRIAPFRIHVRKAKVVYPECTLEVITRSRGICNNHKADPVHLRNRRITDQANPFFTFTTKVLYDRFQIRRMATALEVREIREVHREGVVNPVLFMAILHAVRSADRHVQVLRAEAPFVIIAGTVNRTFTELQGKTDRRLIGLRFSTIFVMNFHLQRLVRREVLGIRFKKSSHAHFLPWAHVMVFQNEGRFLERSIRIGIAFRDRIGRLVILFCIFAVIDGRDLDVGRIHHRDRFRDAAFNTVHFDNLRIFIGRCAIKACNRRFFPGISQNAKTYHLDLRFGNTRTEAAKPHTGILGFRKDFLIAATRRRNNRIVLVQRDSPSAPAILQFFKFCLIRARKVDAVTDKADIRIKGAVLIDIFGIVGTFTQVVFSTVDGPGRVAFFIEILEVIACNIPSRRIHRSKSQRICPALRITAVPHHTGFFCAGHFVKAAVMSSRRHAKLVFTIVYTIRLMAVNRNIFTDKAQVDKD